jgi:hypothetical protein
MMEAQGCVEPPSTPILFSTPPGEFTPFIALDLFNSPSPTALSRSLPSFTKPKRTSNTPPRSPSTSSWALSRSVDFKKRAPRTSQGVSCRDADKALGIWVLEMERAEGEGGVLQNDGRAVEEVGVGEKEEVEVEIE